MSETALAIRYEFCPRCLWFGRGQCWKCTFRKLRNESVSAFDAHVFAGSIVGIVREMPSKIAGVDTRLLGGVAAAMGATLTRGDLSDAFRDASEELLSEYVFDEFPEFPDE